MSVKTPWAKTRVSIWDRTNYKSHVGYKWYGGRGIKCLISSLELKELWFRDKAYEMKRPSIDRIDKNGHYTKENCRYIELKLNSSLGARRYGQCPKGHNNFTYRTRKRNGGEYRSRTCKTCDLLRCHRNKPRHPNYALSNIARLSNYVGIYRCIHNGNLMWQCNRWINGKQIKTSRTHTLSDAIKLYQKKFGSSPKRKKRP